MTRQNISVGAAANDGTGDTLRQAGIKINENFVEIYRALGGDSDILSPQITLDSSGIIFEGSSTDDYETRLTVENPTADRVVTIPNYTGEFVIDSDTQTLKNKTLIDPGLVHPDICDSANAVNFYSLLPVNASLMTKPINLRLPLLADSDTIVTNTSTSTLTNKTLTTPTLNSPTIGTLVSDANGADIIKLTATSSAVNEITIANAATGSGPTISATGDNTNINLNLNAKGTGSVEVGKLALNHATQTSSGAVSTTASFIIFNSGSALAATLADGTTTGETKIMVNSNTGTATVTPSNFAQGASFAIAANGSAQIIWSGSNWFVIDGLGSAYITIA